jgi:hypothetical protein
LSTTNVSANPASNATADPAMADDKLAAWLVEQRRAGRCITLVFARHLCAFATDNPADTKLVFGDVDILSLPVLKQCAKDKHLVCVEVDYIALTAATTIQPEWTKQNAGMTGRAVDKWYASRQQLFTKGRGKPLKPRDETRVWHEAGARCMYRGCGEDLSRTSLTTKSAAAAYLAHIVASDEDGPRGDPQWSHRLSDDPDNVMLMCDEHHRLIDRIDVLGHSREYLQAMRSEHVGKVGAALDSLRYPHTRGIAILGDIGNVKTSFHQRDMREAMLARGLSPVPEIDQLVRHFNRDDRISPDYWRWVLTEHENDFRELTRRLGAAQPLGDGIEVLAVFPLHYVPILILCGRIVGEARQVEIFQYSHGKSWQWPANSTPQPDKFFFVDDAKGVSSTRSAEVVLTLELTAEVDLNAFPDEIKHGIEAGHLPWLRVRAQSPAPTCITHWQDLVQFTIVARQAVNHVQDVVRASTVHLFGISPASTLFRFGQILQPGHHSDYIVYDRPDRNKLFNAAIRITGQVVQDAVPAGSVPGVTIKLR